MYSFIDTSWSCKKKWNAMMARREGEGLLVRTVKVGKERTGL